VAPLHGETVRLTVLGTGSRGNAFLVESGGDAIMVDAGFSLRDLRRRAALAGVDLSNVRAVVVTHEHGDHSRGAIRAVTEWRVPLAASAGTLRALEPGLPRGAPSVALAAARSAAVGPFLVTSFPTAHDAADPVVLVVEDQGGLRVGIACDVGSPTAALAHSLKGLDAVVIESNHDEVMLRSSDYPPSVRSRIAGSRGHLSNTQAARLVADAAHSSLDLVVLVHLSEQCNRPHLALTAMRQALEKRGFKGRLMVAGQDAPLPSVEIGGALEQLALPLGPAGGRRRGVA
jgi:phosphoribosyl 1,2-cyclic phosphodiesterase